MQMQQTKPRSWLVRLMADEMSYPGVWPGDCTIYAPPKPTRAMNNLARLICLKGYGLNAAAEDAGVHPQHLARMLGGRAQMPASQMFALARFFDCSMDDLFGLGKEATA